MPKTSHHKHKSYFAVGKLFFYITGASFLLLLISYTISCNDLFSIKYDSSKIVIKTAPPKPKLNKILYDRKLYEMANTGLPMATASASTTPELWPVKTAYPKAGAILPFKRIIAFYGNFLSTGMGVLGQYPKEVVLEKLREEMSKWQKVSSTTPVVPAIDYIAITAQESSGIDGKYRLRMSDSEIQKALSMAKEIDGIVFLDIQIGLSTLQIELPLLEKYLKLPQVHLAIDPEFSMKTGARPGTVIGSFDASDINYTTEYLAKLVRNNNLPPKLLVIHRFTKPMVTNYKNIQPLPEVQIIMDMDGWGTPGKKFGTYNAVIYPEPVQFTGFKLFYKNDLLPPSTHILTPEELLKLKPQPMYIQYQ
ncbi:MAG: hypothetical protein EXS46_01945 [Candidatus Taylorbacteria bacterium]|nr:hypothetical protein [Candidatus Taylorbacteria bacterium]